MVELYLNMPCTSPSLQASNRSMDPHPPFSTREIADARRVFLLRPSIPTNASLAHIISIYIIIVNVGTNVVGFGSPESLSQYAFATTPYEWSMESPSVIQG